MQVVRYSHWIPKLISKYMPITAITLWPFILFTDNNWRVQWQFHPTMGVQEAMRLKDHQAIILRHEMIHLAQYKELWVLGFLALYGWQYLQGRFRGHTHFMAYRYIKFEREAYKNQKDTDYLSKRKPQAWKGY